MTKEELIQKINQVHQNVNQMILGLDDSILFEKKEAGWNGAQHIGHLTKSLIATNRGLGLPKLILRWKFGKNNRIEKSYQEVIDKYLQKLQTTNVSNNPFQLDIPQYDKKELLDVYKSEQEKFIKKLNTYSETQLSNLLLPHPLLGRLTIREFTYFTIYHTEHHTKVLSDKSH